MNKESPKIILTWNEYCKQHPEPRFSNPTSLDRRGVTSRINRDASVISRCREPCSQFLCSKRYKIRTRLGETILIVPQVVASSCLHPNFGRSFSWMTCPPATNNAFVIHANSYAATRKVFCAQEKWSMTRQDLCGKATVILVRAASVTAVDGSREVARKKLERTQE